MNVAKRLLNHKGEVRGIWWFCFLHDISNSYLSSAGQRLMNCWSHVMCCLCRMHWARTNSWDRAVLVSVHNSAPQTSLITSSLWLAFPSMLDLHLSLVTLSPWGNWGIRQVNGICKTSVIDPDCCGHELQNCSSFLTLRSIPQQIFCWAGWQTCLDGEPWSGLWQEAICVVKDGWYRNIQSACSYNLDRLLMPRKDKCVWACITKS